MLLVLNISYLFWLLGLLTELTGQSVISAITIGSYKLCTFINFALSWVLLTQWLKHIIGPSQSYKFYTYVPFSERESFIWTHWSKRLAEVIKHLQVVRTR